MLGWALIFLIIAIVAGFLGFGGITSTATGIAQVLFFVFVVLLAVSLLLNLVHGRHRIVHGRHRHTRH
ncbi:DUF1328 domain-containing protein [Arhodomonas sp. AD133]|uniref:DUF1328 domain-containing protein n=1 Tax=Arhodomonas sp. AD133 TaxID=3415009 RepID=UPI003EBB7302